MTKENMTIRFTPDGFLFAECPNSASILLEDAPLHEVSPGPDFQERLHGQLLDCLTTDDGIRDVTCQFMNTRVLVLPSDATDYDVACQMYHLTLGKGEGEEQILLQPLKLPTGQEVTLCFGIDRSLYYFLVRNFGEVVFEHHIATLLVEAARMASGQCMVVRCDSQILELALFRQGRLDIVNVFRASHAENRSYYIMNAWQQQGLDQLHDSLLVISQNTESLQIRANLHRFIKHVFG